MNIKVDKFFILELKEQGYDLDYKKITEIYRKSRNREDFKEHKKHSDLVNNYINEQMAKLFK